MASVGRLARETSIDVVRGADVLLLHALVGYLMAPFLLSLFALSAQLSGGVNFYEKLGDNTWVGFVRSTVFAWIVVRLCGLLRDAGVRMQI